MRHDQKMAAAWQRCVEFNDSIPIGSSVLVAEQNKTAEAKTASAAHALPNGEAVVGLKDLDGAVSLDRVQLSK